MKLKYSICAAMLALSMSLLPQAALAAEAPLVEAPGDEPVPAPTVVYEEVMPQLEHVAEVNENEQVVIPEDTLIDLILPDTLNGETITRIGEGCFRGCDVIRSVTIPATVTEIAADAFADCPYLEVIYFEGRADAEDLILGENWNGNAEVEFLLVAVEEDEQKAETDTEQAEPSDEEAPADTPDASEPIEDGTAPEDDVQPSDEPSEPTGGNQKPAEPASDATGATGTTGSEDPAVSDGAAAGEGTPPSDPQPSDPSEGTTTDPATEPAADSAAADSAE